MKSDSYFDFDLQQHFKVSCAEHLLIINVVWYSGGEGGGGFSNSGHGLVLNQRCLVLWRQGSVTMDMVER